MHQWKAAQFAAATPQGRIGVIGLAYHGIGLECVTDDTGGNWSDDWELTHLASGSRLGTIVGLDEAEVFKLATVIADLTDWRACSDLDGFLEAAPGLASQLLVLADLAGSSFIVTGVASPMPRVSNGRANWSEQPF